MFVVAFIVVDCKFYIIDYQCFNFNFKLFFVRLIVVMLLNCLWQEAGIYGIFES